MVVSIASTLKPKYYNNEDPYVFPGCSYEEIPLSYDGA